MTKKKSEAHKTKVSHKLYRGKARAQEVNFTCSTRRSPCIGLAVSLCSALRCDGAVKGVIGVLTIPLNAGAPPCGVAAGGGGNLKTAEPEAEVFPFFGQRVGESTSATVPRGIPWDLGMTSDFDVLCTTGAGPVVL